MCLPHNIRKNCVEKCQIHVILFSKNTICRYLYLVQWSITTQSWSYKILIIVKKKPSIVTSQTLNPECC